MIDTIKVFALAISAVLCFLVPIAGYFIAKDRKGRYPGVLIGGVLSFYLTQMIIRIPILQLLLPKLDWYRKMSGNIFLLALFLGFTAALFETFGRWLTLNYLLKKRLSYRTGIVHGLGHGGIEAILLVGLNYVIFTVFAVLLNRGNESPLQFLIRGQHELIIGLLSDTEWQLFMLAGVERTMTIIFHVAMSLMVTIGIVKGRQRMYIALVLFWHTLLDFLAVMASSWTTNVYLIEFIVVIAAVASAIYIYKSRNTIVSSPSEDEGQKAVDEGF